MLRGVSAIRSAARLTAGKTNHLSTVRSFYLSVPADSDSIFFL